MPAKEAYDNQRRLKGGWTMDMVPYDLRWCCPIWYKVVPKLDGPRWSYIVQDVARYSLIVLFIILHSLREFQIVASSRM